MPDPVLAVIPCRGGSRRIPRKWAALVNGKPLLQHTIDIARAANTITRLVVSTEDPAIAAYARLRGVEVVNRPADLADDDTTIADVVTHTVNTLQWEHDVVVLQPTCPLLKPETVDRVIGEFHTVRFDWGITVADDPHLFWQHGRPLTPRVNSQRLGTDRLQRETGAVQLFSPQAARGLPGLRGTFPIDPTEALDIDTPADLDVARHHLGRRTIGFHVVASDEKGSGHLRRCLQLTDAFTDHDVWWSPVGLEGWAVDVADRHGVRWAANPPAPDLAIIDCLDRADRLSARYAASNVPTVVFEPEGSARHASLVIDEFTNPELAILRPEFLCLPPFGVRDKADRVLISFGGTDPAGMNYRLERIVNHGADVTVDVMRPQDGRSMAEAMCQADLVITSQGRTVHEAAAVGVPCLSIAVNERETRHAMLPGVIYLGLAHCLSDVTVLDTVNRLLMSPNLRAEMSVTSRRQIDGWGISRVVRMIEGLWDAS